MMRIVLYSAVATATTLGVLGVAVLHGAGPGLPDFEVASIRPHIGQDRETSTTVFPGGRLVAVNLNLRKMIRNAFDVEDYQISGAPHWVDSATYDIEARMPAGIEISREDISDLLASLLRQRFHLKYRKETAELTEYSLEVAKNGPKLQVHTGADETFSNTTSRAGVVHLAARRIPMSDLAYSLRRQLGRPVLDKTGLNGDYDVDLTWSTEEASDSSQPSLFSALRAVGLRLLSGKGPVEMIVVDGIENVSDN